MLECETIDFLGILVEAEQYGIAVGQADVRRPITTQGYAFQMEHGFDFAGWDRDADHIRGVILIFLVHVDEFAVGGPSEGTKTSGDKL